MRRAEILEGVRMMRFLDVFGRCERRELSKLEAAKLEGIHAGLRVKLRSAPTYLNPTPAKTI